MLARLSEYQILSERVASLSIHWPPRRSVDHASRKYDLCVLRGADHVVAHLAVPKPQAARWDTSTTSATASATTGFNLETVEYKTISFAVRRLRPVRVAPL